jgi:MYND finger protein
MSDSNEGTNPESQACIHCRSPTAKRCTGCLGAPDYDNKPSVSTFYCSFECQKADWPRHRIECRKLQARKSLSRAASLLQAIVYKIRMHATTLEITSVHVEGTTVYLNGPLPNPFCSQQLKPFPVHLFKDQAILESALVYTACMDAMVFLYSFAMEMLRGQILTSHINLH